MKEILKTISRNEWRFVFLMALGVVIITGAPYLVGLFFTPPSYVYTGLHALSPGDVPVYYSYITQVAEGNVTVKNLFTSEPQAYGTFNIWWGLVGGVARLFSLSAALTFQIFRLVTAFSFVFLAYFFLAFFFSSVSQRKIALGLLLFSSGLGAYFAAGLDQIQFDPDAARYPWPIDLWLTESITFNALLQTSHFIVSLALMLLILLLAYLAVEKNCWRYAVVAGLLSLVYFNFHPYYLPIIYGVPGLYILVRTLVEKKITWVHVGRWAVVVLLSLPSVAYHIFLIKAEPVIGLRALQNVTLISSPLYVLIGYGFLGPVAVVGVYLLWKRNSFSRIFQYLGVWLLLNLFLIAINAPFQSRFTQGVHVALVIFATAGLFGIAEWLRQKLTSRRYDFWVNNPALLAIGFLVLFAPSVLFMFFRDVYILSAQPGIIKELFFWSPDFIAATNYLAEQPRGGLVLATEIPSRFIPGLAGQTVFLGHMHETLNFKARELELRWFYRPKTSDRARIDFLRHSGIDYVLFGPYEKQLGHFDPAGKNYLAPVVVTDTVVLYRVTAE